MLLRGMTVALLVVAAPAWAGERDKSVTWTGLDRTPDISLAYRGSGWTLTNPGLSTSCTFTLAERTRTVQRHDKPKRRRTREIYAGGELGFNVFKSNNTMVPLTLMLGTRSVRTRGFTTGFLLLAGVNRSVLNRVSWSVDDGQLRRHYLVGRTSLALGAGWELGFDRGRQGKHNLHTFTRPSVMVLTPWTAGPVPVVQWDVGVRVALSSLRKRP